MFWKRSKRIYLDYASLAPRDEKLFSKLEQSVSRGNPSSFHKEGVSAKNTLEEARTLVADQIHALSDEIVFTSGGTEGDNIAILGVLKAYTGGGVPHMIVSAVEHSAVLETIKALETRGKISLSYVPVDARGVVDVRELRAMIRPETILISVMLVNNEIGTIEPVAEVAKAIRHYRKMTRSQAPNSNDTSVAKAENMNSWNLDIGDWDLHEAKYPLLHVDACQAPNYLPIDVRALHPDLLTLNGSKIYTGAGVGALFVKRGTPIQSIMHGGDQERGLRPGTPDVKKISEFAVALAECARARDTEMEKYDELRTLLVSGVETVCKKYDIEMTLLSDPFVCVPAIVNVSFAGFESELLVIELDAQGIAVSSKSACKSESEDLSHVLSAMGKSASWEIPANIGSIRFSFGRWATKGDIQRTVKALGSIFLKYKKSN